MLLPKQVTDLMGKKVEYCRAKVDDKGQSELQRGTGIIVGVIIGATKRIQIMVRDMEASADKAWTLDPMCINPSEREVQEYFAHHKRIRAVVDEHNAAQKQREQDKIKEVDEINYAFFGQPLAI